MSEATTRAEIATRATDHAWFVLLGTLPEAPYIRAVIEVDPTSIVKGDGYPPRPARETYIYYLEALDDPADEWVTLVDRVTTMSEDEFGAELKAGTIVPIRPGL